MASDPNAAASSAFVRFLLQSLMGRPRYLDTNSFLSHSLEDGQEEDGQLDAFFGDGTGHRRLLAKEEARLEREIVKIVRSANAREKLKANSGRSVAVGGHDICVVVNEEAGSEHRVWQWHGRIMVFDEEKGSYSAEYIYGFYYEPKDDEEGMKVKAGANCGLRDLIGDSKDSDGNGGGGRVLHRNSLNSGSSARSIYLFPALGL